MRVGLTSAGGVHGLHALLDFLLRQGLGELGGELQTKGPMRSNGGHRAQQSKKRWDGRLTLESSAASIVPEPSVSNLLKALRRFFISFGETPIGSATSPCAVCCFAIFCFRSCERGERDCQSPPRSA